MLTKSLIAFVAGALASGPASASYTITLSPPVIWGTYYEQNAKCEGGGSGCVLGFSPVPAHKILAIHKANCLINSDSIPYSMALGTTNTGPDGLILRPQYFPVSITSTTENPTRQAIAVDLTTEMLVGGKPAIEYRVRGNATDMLMVCQISGELRPN